MERRVIAEIGSCGGDKQLAIDTALAALGAGAWLVKGQMFRAETLTTRTAKPYGKGIVEAATQWEAFEGALSYDDWWEVATACIDAGQHRFFASVFDGEAVANSDPAWPFVKIASADITHRELIEAAAVHGPEVMLSTGASHRSEVERAVGWIRDAGGGEPVVLACTLSYPCEVGDAHVARMWALTDLGIGRVGYSDHTRGLLAPLTALAAGAFAVEKHFTIRPGTGGDNDFAIGPREVERLAAGADGFPYWASPAWGDWQLRPHSCERAARALARRSWYYARDVAPGEQLQPRDVVALRPAGGWEPSDYSLFQQMLQRPGYQGQPVVPADFDADPERSQWVQA